MPDQVYPEPTTGALIFDRAGRLFLMKSHKWEGKWVIPGGHVDLGERIENAVRREVKEETGYDVPVGALVGPVWERTAVFDFMHRPYVQHEEFFTASVGDAVGRHPIVWTEAEHDTLEAAEWHTPEEIRRFDIEVFPLDLGELLSTVLPWDGRLRHLGREEA